MDHRTLTGIRRTWERRAATEGDNPHCTLPDYHLRHLEAQYILRHLQGDEEALDIGCGNGTTTVLFAERVRSMIGGDSSPTMLKKARKLHPRKNLTYRLLNVLHLNLPNSHFDVVITERCLINLPDFEHQKQALREIARVLRPGGRLLLCESFEEAFVRFAALRQSFGLQPIQRHAHNFLIPEKELLAFTPEFFSICAVEKMGMYYLVSRIVHPLLVAPDEPRYDAPINDTAVQMTLAMDPAACAEYSVNGLYVLQKR